MVRWQTAPALPWHEVDACAPAAPAATWLTAAHSPREAPAVHSVRASARFSPPRVGTAAVPMVSMRHPAPAQPAVTSTRPFADSPPDVTEHRPTAAHVDVDRPRMPASPAAVTSVVDDVRIAQPVVLPSAHDASTNAEEVANRWSGPAPAAEAAALEPAEIFATHAAAPMQAVSAVAVLWLGVPSPAVALPLKVAVQPASEQTASEPACPLAGAPEPRPVATDASLFTPHPEAAAVQVAAV